MSDVHSASTRSFNMSQIKSRDSGPEIIVRSFLFSKGLRFRKNVKSLPGTPDIVLKKYNVVVFVNGCFWHGHTCKKGKLPKSRIEFWKGKIEGNKMRDIKKLAILQKNGWRALILWQCDISNEEKRSTRLNMLYKDIIAG